MQQTRILMQTAYFSSGFLIYFGYGMWHSVERQRQLQLQGPPNSTQENKQQVGTAAKDQERFICPEKTSQC